MQEAQVFTYGMGMWDGGTKSQELFGLYLFVTTCVSLVRMFRLSRCIWPFRRNRVSFIDGDKDVEVLAGAALRGGLKMEASQTQPPKSPQAIDLSNDSALIFKLDCINTRFVYLWETCCAKVRVTKTLMSLTVILAFAVTALGAAITCMGIRVQPSVSSAAIAGGLLDVFRILAEGLLVSAFFYALSCWFEIVLINRRTNWNYLRARYKEKFSSSSSN